MNRLRNFLLWLAGVVLLLLAISYLLPSETRVERSLNSAASPEVIFSMIEDLEQWPNWSPWHAQDPEMAIVYGDIRSGEGAYYEWKGEIIGKGSYLIEQVNPPASLIARLDMGQPEPSQDRWILEPTTGGGTRITWAVISPANDPISKYVGLLLKPLIGRDLETGLANLSAAAEEMKQNTHDTPATEPPSGLPQ